MTHTLAQINATTLPTYFPSAAHFGSIGALTAIVVPAFVTIAALTFLVMLFLGIFKIFTSQGNSEQIASGRSTITWGVVGLIVIICAYLIVKVISIILQVPLPF